MSQAGWASALPAAAQAVIPNAGVSLTDTTGNYTYPATHGRNGRHKPRSMPRGNYSLRFEAAGLLTF